MPSIKHTYPRFKRNILHVVHRLLIDEDDLVNNKDYNARTNWILMDGFEIVLTGKLIYDPYKRRNPSRVTLSCSAI